MITNCTMLDSLIHLTFNQNDQGGEFGIFKGKELQGLIGVQDFLKSYSNDEIENKELVISTDSPDELPDFLQDNQLLTYSEHFNSNGFLDMPIFLKDKVNELQIYQSYYVFKEKLLFKTDRVMIVGSSPNLTIDIVSNVGHSESFNLPSLGSVGNLMGQDNFAETVIKRAIKKFSPTRIIICGKDCSELAKMLYDIECKVLLEPHLIHYAFSFLSSSTLGTSYKH